jgi:hypothetical protein
VSVTGIGAGFARHWNGTTWTTIALPSGVNPRDVWGTGPDDVYFSADVGKIIHYNGTSFSEMRTDLAQNVFSVWGIGGKLFGCASLGNALVRHRQCTAAEVCDNGTDDDCDGYVDCSDSTCGAASYCTGGGACGTAPMLTCDAPATTGSLTGGNAKLDVNSCDTWLRNGREKTYRVQRATTGTVTLTLSGLTNDLDLLVLAQTNGGACNPYNPGCLAVSANTNRTNETITFTAQANVPYYVVVDGYGTYNATYALSAACP